MGKKEFIKRLILFTIGLFFSGLGIAFSKHADLGISTVSSIANVLSVKFDFISFGMWSTISNCAFVPVRDIHGYRALYRIVYSDAELRCKNGAYNRGNIYPRVRNRSRGSRECAF